MVNTMDRYDQQISDAQRLKLGGVMRIAVLERIEQANLNDEEYTEEQFNYWIECLNSAAGWVDDPEVASGIYRDIGYLLMAKGDKDGAIRYFEGSLDAYPETDMRFDIERQINNLKN